jgi:succinate dehydrogenase / fumarate reductase cytochrome b subunit
MAIKFLSSQIGKKIGMALTGLALYGFLVGHLAGNLLLVKEDGGEAFNAYSKFLTGHPLIIPIELVLLAIFLIHIALAISVTRENRRARPIGYQARSQAVGGRNWASRTMIYSGILIFVFVVLHIRAFKFGDLGTGTLFDLVVDTFNQTGPKVWYVVAMAVLGFHLWHAFQSAFQTLGLKSRIVRGLGLALSLILAIGFGFLPLYLGASL